MAEEAEVTMALYRGLLPAEEAKLKAIEGDVIILMLDRGDTRRPFWGTRTDSDGRFVLLQVPGKLEPETLLELPEGELANLSGSDILSRLRDRLG